MKVDIANVIVAYDYTDELYQWCEKNLTFTNPDYVQRVKLKKYVGNVSKKFQLFRRDGNRLIIPFGVLRKIMPMIHGSEITPRFHEPTKVDYGNIDLQLYDYQETAVSVAIKNKFGIIKSPTGSGKTTMGVALIQRLGLKALWITHTQELLDQARNRAEQFFDHKLIGSIEQGKVDISDGVTFALIQTLEKLDLHELRNTWDVIIVDECHRVCTTPKSVGMFYKVLTNLAARHKFGISATTTRHDGLHGVMFAAIGEIVWEVPPEACADKRIKASVSFFGTDVPFSIDMLSSDGMINWTRMIDCLCLNEFRNELIIEHLVKEIKADHYCLLLSDRVQHLSILHDMLPPEIQKECVIINGKTKKNERREAVDIVRAGAKHCFMASFNLAKEGLDIPILDRLFFATPHQNHIVLTQSIGRIERKHPHKTEAIVYDYVDNTLPNCMINFKRRRAFYLKEGHTINAPEK